LERLAAEDHVLDDELLHVLELAGHHDVGVDQRPAPDADVRAELAPERVIISTFRTLRSCGFVPTESMERRIDAIRAGLADPW
ncbi:MAG: hypothetical protein ACKOHI_09250, partial [Phycisphaerales bacterium]